MLCLYKYTVILLSNSRREGQIKRREGNLWLLLGLV